MSKIVWLVKSSQSNHDHLEKEVRELSDLDLRLLNENNLEKQLHELRSSIPVVVIEVSKDLDEHDKIIKILKKNNKSTKIICTSDRESKQLFIKLIRLNITDYVDSPLNFNSLEELSQKHSYERRKYSNKIMDPYFSKSKKINDLIKTIDQISARPINLLFTGESGSGKEFFSDYFVQNSSRRDKPFITVNCPAIPENLLESELFGHEKGSFTGADEKKIGKIELSNGGILFLDEIGDLPKNAQTKLLRVIQEKEIERIGGTKKIPVDFLLISATSKNIKEEIQKNHFRADLYYRIAEIELEVPSLKKRIEDIDHLSRLFINEFASEMKMEKKRLNAEAIKTLSLHNWPGNIRELRSTVKKLLILSKHDIIQKSDILEQIPQLKNVIDIKSKNTDQVNDVSELRIENTERSLIGKAIQESKGNLSKAAKIVGLSRSTLYRKIKKYDLKFSA